MEQNESTKTRIVLLQILDDLKQNVLDRNSKKVNQNNKDLKEEYAHYEELDN